MRTGADMHGADICFAGLNVSSSRMPPHPPRAPNRLQQQGRPDGAMRPQTAATLNGEWHWDKDTPTIGNVNLYGCSPRASPGFSGKSSQRE